MFLTIIILSALVFWPIVLGTWYFFGEKAMTVVTWGLVFGSLAIICSLPFLTYFLILYVCS